MTTRLDASDSPAPELGNLCRFVAVAFVVLIAWGTWAFRSSFATQEGLSISLFDAVFLSTSAVCGSGLSTINPSTVLSTFGWVNVALLMELGSLGVLILGAAVVEAIHARFPSPTPLPALSMRSLAARVVAWTLGLQAIGAIVLTLQWEDDAPFAERLSLGVFHAISAACHGGFTPAPEALAHARYGLLTHGTLATLILLGGLGYPVLRDVVHAVRSRGKHRLAPFTKLSLASTAAFYLVGVLLLTAAALAPYGYEYFQLGISSSMPVTGPLTGEQAGAAVADASFLSISARSAGLSPVAIGDLTPAAHVALLVLSILGGLPGGAGGGVFAVTPALVFLAMWRTLRRRAADAGSQSLDAALRLAIGVAPPFALLLLSSLFLVSLFEPYPFIKVLFETASAASSNAFSLGVTPELTRFSKSILFALMFAGRLLPLSLLAHALSSPPPGLPLQRQAP